MTKVLAVGTDVDLCEAHMLAGLAQHGVEIDVLMDPARAHAGILESAGIRFSTILLHGRIDPQSIVALRRILRQGNYDIVHCFSNRALSNIILASWGIPFKLIAYRGTMGHLSRLDPLSWLTYLNPRIDKILCISNAVRGYLSQYISEQKLVRIYKGQSASWYSKEASVPLTEFKIPEGAFVVACVANMRPVKGVPYIIKALQYIPVDKNVHLLLIGKIQDKDVRHLLNDPLLVERVHYAGFQRNVTGLVSQCNAFVMASVKREGLSKALQEAMIVGVPPIVTAVGGMPEVVVNGECGLVVPPCSAEAIAEAILSLQSDPARCREYGIKARERIGTNFRIEDSITEVLQVYNQLLSRTSSRPLTA